MNTSEVLNKAADIIQDRGFWQGPGGGGVLGGTCASNAIGTAAEGGRDSFWPAHAVLLSYIGAPDLTDTSHIFAWNDAPERTQAEVVEALRACAVIEASRERETATV